MKKNVTDGKHVKEFSIKLQAWLQGQVGEETVQVPAAAALAEYPVYRLTYRAETESRIISKFSRPDSTPVGKVASIISADQVDVQSIECEKVRDFVHQREVKVLPESVSGAACPLCGGKGKRDCPECNGQKGLYCPECRGDGKIICPACKRTRKVNCTKCKGHGKVYDDASQTFKPCGECQGKGELACTVCDAGYKVCTVCGGKGRTPCGRCEQTGEIECTTCGGKGQIISGLQMEVVFEPRESIMEIVNDEIPAHVAEQIAAQGTYHAEIVLRDDPLTVETLKAGGVPQELGAAVDQVRSAAGMPFNSRVVTNILTIEKKAVYAMSYASGAAQKTVWAAARGEGLVVEHGFVAETYASLLDNIRQYVRKGDLSAASDACRTVRGVGPLRTEVLAIEKVIRRKNFRSYITGAFAGAAVFLAAVIPALHAWRGNSLHFSVLIAGAVLAAVVTSVGMAVALLALDAHFLAGGMKKFFGTLGGTVAGLTLFFGSCALSGFDPARALDRSAMAAEYRAHFPFGLRTLANSEDIDFLKRLIARYEPTGIDVLAVRNDLATLENKQKADEENIARIEGISRDMQNMLTYGRNKRAWSRRKTPAK